VEVIDLQATERWSVPLARQCELVGCLCLLSQGYLQMHVAGISQLPNEDFGSVAGVCCEGKYIQTAAAR